MATKYKKHRPMRRPRRVNLPFFEQLWLQYNSSCFIFRPISYYHFRGGLSFVICSGGFAAPEVVAGREGRLVQIRLLLLRILVSVFVVLGEGLLVFVFDRSQISAVTSTPPLQRRLLHSISKPEVDYD